MRLTSAKKPLIVALAMLTLLAAACGGGDDSGGTATPTTQSGATTTPASGDTRAFKVMVISDFTSTIAFTTPEALPSAKGALRNLPNVEVLGCDSKGDPNAAQACQRDAVAKGVAAVIVGFGNVGQDMAVLTAAGIPVLGQSDITKDNGFGLASGLGQYVGMGVGVVKNGCEKVGVLYLDGTDFLVDEVKKGVESEGGKEAARAAVPATAPDLAPAVSKLLNADVQCIVLSVTPPMLVQAITAINQTGKKPFLAAVGAILTKQVRDSLGPLADNIMSSEIQLNPDDSNQAAFKSMRADLDAIDKKTKITTIGIFSWASGKLIEAALENVQGVVTKESLTTALNGMRDVDLDGILHPFSAIPLKNPAYKRFFNHYAINYMIEKGELKKAGDFFDIGPVLDQP